MSRTPINPETFADAFMSKPDNHLVYYGVESVALRRELMDVFHEILRSEFRPGSPVMLGGSLLRAMVKAGECSLAEAVAEIWEFVEAEAGTDRWTREDVILAALCDEDDALADAEGPEAKARRDEIAPLVCDRVRSLAIELCREAGEDEVADLAEFYPGTLNMLCKSARRDGVPELPDWEADSKQQFYFTS